MALTDENSAALGKFLAAALGVPRVRLAPPAKLGGGAIQENWALEVESNGARHSLVLRTNSPSGVAASHDRIAEFALLSAAHRAGVTVPAPVALCTDAAVIGKPFYVMRRVAGTAAGHILVRDDKWRGDRVALAERLGRELARIHTIVPPRADLGFLRAVGDNPARDAVAGYRAWLDHYPQPRPALEWGLRWLDRNAPPKAEIVLCHRDFRTGNYMVDEHGLTGVLDWEFAGWGDPMEDLGWLCAKCWRFGANAREAGGVGAREDFYRGYEAESRRKVDDSAVRYWEAMAHARWAVIALQQGWRHISGAERSLDLALTGRRIAELEHELLGMTAPGQAA
jgi:aminoglycoside phosphotransferase (APT) family kinase protein